MCLEVWLLQVQVCIGDVTPSHLSPMQGGRQGALQALFTESPSTEAEVMCKMHLSLCLLSFFTVASCNDSVLFSVITISISLVTGVCHAGSPLKGLFL